MQRSKISKRSQFIGAIFLLLFFLILLRYYDLQKVEAAWYQEKAERMWNKESILKAKRGTIYDRYGQTLAKESTSYTVAAILNKHDENHVQDPFSTAQALAPFLKMSVEQLHRLLTAEDRYQVELRPGGRQIDRALMEEIKELKLPGIIFIEEPKRYYPNNDFASHVLGFVDHDGQPIMGLEAHLNEILEGKDGTIHFSKDAKGNRLPQGLKSIVPAQHGQDIYLTIDERIQLYVEQALDEAQAAYKPEKISVIISKPQTGEIIAMASRPSFNPNQFTEGIENYVNHAITSTFEPGSTFKIITLAAAIEEGIYKGEETYLSGTYKVPGGTIGDHRREGWGQISFLEGVQKSSNVAFTILGYERMKREIFYNYIYNFGFNELTGIDLPYEKRGFVRPINAAYPLDVATMTFGQGVSVTAIQQVAAVNAIANGGTLLKPYIISRIEDPNTGEVILQNEPTVVREQVVSKKTAQQVADILETVVTEGTGKNYFLEGYHVAGKTGTAQKVGDNGRYINGQYIFSFIGFVPKDDPQLVVYVVVDAPQVDYYSGGSVVAQIFKSITLNSLQHLQVQPDIEEVQIAQEVNEGKKLADYQQMSVQVAKERLEAEGYEVHIFGDGTFVKKQMPAPGTIMYAHNPVYFFSEESAEIILPDFSGWSLRKLMDWATITKVDLRVLGEGYAFRQSRAPGQAIQVGEQVFVDLQPRFQKKETEFLGDEPLGDEANPEEHVLEGRQVE